jgi:hypothetical protein
MPNVEKFLNQTVTVERRRRKPNGEVELDRFGQPLYDFPDNVAARKVEHEGVIRSATGQDVEDESEVITGPEDVVRVGDLIDGDTVRRVEAKRSRRGELIGHWSYL